MSCSADLLKMLRRSTDDVKLAYSFSSAHIMAMHTNSSSSCLRSKFMGWRFCILDIEPLILDIRVCKDSVLFFLIEKKLLYVLNLVPGLFCMCVASSVVQILIGSSLNS